MRYLVEKGENVAGASRSPPALHLRNGLGILPGGPGVLPDLPQWRAAGIELAKACESLLAPREHPPSLLVSCCPCKQRVVIDVSRMSPATRCAQCKR